MSGTWFRISLSGEQVAAGHFERIRDSFTDLFIAAGSPAGTAMFTVPGDDGGIDLYVNPSAVDVAQDFLKQNSAIACPPPLNEGGLTLVVGHQGDQRLLSS